MGWKYMISEWRFVKYPLKSGYEDVYICQTNWSVIALFSLIKSRIFSKAPLKLEILGGK